MKQYKVIVMGLDGATFDLVKPWAEQGKLPAFRRLLAEGAAGELRSTIPPMTGPAWTSFMTGKNPGKHGIYDWVARYDDRYDFYPTTAQHCQEPALWDQLSSQGKRVCLINIPMTFPPKPVNGIVISGMPAPSTRVTITYPQSLLAEIENEFGEYLLYPDPGQAYSDAGVDGFLDRLYRTTEKRFKILEYLRAREDWDFSMAVINGTDTVSHAMWKFMDPAHPLHDPKKYSKYGSAILDYYRYVDSELNTLVHGLDEDTVLMLMSDHGFGPFYKFIHVNNWLMDQGFLTLINRPLASLKGILFKLGFTPMNVYDLLMQFGLGKLKREVVRGQGQEMLKSLFLSFKEVDWATTRAYSLGNVGQIRINLRGREPSGCVTPGEEYEKTRASIMARLRELRDPRTGEKVIDEIYRREEIYHGRQVEQAADILFIPKRMEYFGFGEYEFGSNRIIEGMKRGISGTHRMNGLMLMWGKPIRQGFWQKGAQIIDLAPTILHLMGQPVPTDIDGHVLTETLDPQYAGMVQVHEETTDISSEEKSPPNDLTAEEVELIMNRMRGLGYVA